MRKPDEERNEQAGFQRPLYEDISGVGRRQGGEREAGVGIDCTKTYGRKGPSQRRRGVHSAQGQASERPQRRSEGNFLILMILFFYVVYLCYDS